MLSLGLRPGVGALHRRQHFAAAAVGAAVSLATSVLAAIDSRQIQKDQPRILSSRLPSIHWNLAFENFVLEDVKPTVPWLFLWQNGKTVVVGHNQNPWRECALQLMEAEGVELARRFSGGGAVYQDMGNTCFSFMYPDGFSNVTRNNQVVLKALKAAYGIEGEASGRNDLLAEGRKFSGFAAKKRGNMWVHHGTVLRDVDMDGLSRYLTPNKMKLESKGVKSVASRVVNLKSLNDSITHDGLVDAIADEFRREFALSGAGVKTEAIDRKSVEAQDPKFLGYLKNLMDWNWRFGITPQFSHKLETRFEWGSVELHLNAEGGVVKDVKVFTDSMLVELPERVREALVGFPYGGQSCSTRMENVARTVGDDLRRQMEDIGGWLLKEMNDEDSHKTHEEL